MPDVKSELKKELSRLQGFENPRVELEQYVTPAGLAADMIHAAYMRKDIEDREVVDLGCGTGILATGAALAGGNVTAVERDPEALEIARQNARDLEAEIDFVEADIREFEGDFDTCVMNPPFSVHSDLGDRFFRTAFEVADAVYGLAPDADRIKDLSAEFWHEVEGVERYTISLPATYGFHTEESQEVEIYLIVTRQI